MTPVPFSPAHLKVLSDRAVSPEVAAERGAETITDSKRLIPLGFKDVQLRPGMLFHAYSPVTGERSFSQLRPDTPRIQKRNGHVRSIKYENPFGGRLGLDAHPRTRAALADVTKPLWIVEGILKEDALISAGAEAVIAIVGVTTWKTLTMLAEWNAIPLARVVYLAFDSDAQSNPDVTKQRAKMTRFLAQRDAVVQHIILPDRDAAHGGGKQGVDDYLAAGHTLADVIALVQKPADTARATPGDTITAQAMELIHEQQVQSFHDRANPAFTYVAVTRAGHLETYDVRGQEFAKWVRRLMYKASGKVLSSEAVRDIGYTVGMESDEYDSPVHLRVAGLNDQTVIDRGDRSWGAVVIDRTGWRTVPHTGMAFRRVGGMLALPEPVPGGSLDQLRTFLNLRKSRDDWLMFLAYVTYAIRGEIGTYPIYVVNGEQGSAKSTFARIVSKLVDPQVDSPQSLSRESRDLGIAAWNSYLLSFDNVREIRDWMSDDLCRISSGAGIRTRELFTDLGEIRLYVKRPVLINGIESPATQSDFLDRSIPVTLPPLTEWRTEKAFWKEWEAAYPKLLGALYDLVVQAMRKVEQVESRTRHRLADFTRWYRAVGAALNIPTSEIEIAAERNQQRQSETQLDNCPVYPALRALMERMPEWKGSASALLSELRVIDPDGAGARMVKGPRALSVMIATRNRRALADAGILVTTYRTNRERGLVVRRANNWR